MPPLTFRLRPPASEARNMWLSSPRCSWWGGSSSSFVAFRTLCVAHGVASQMRRGAPRSRTASGSSPQNAPWVRRPPCSTHGRSVAHLAGSARMISLVSSATHHGISPSCLDQNLPTRFEDPSASGRLKPSNTRFEASLRKNASCGRGLVTSDGSVCPSSALAGRQNDVFIDGCPLAGDPAHPQYHNLDRFLVSRTN